MSADTTNPSDCPTCSPPVRRTVGMVCQTCGTDYAPTKTALTGPALAVGRILAGTAWDRGVPAGRMADIATEIDNAVRPVHIHQAADSLRAIAEHRLATAPDALAHARAEGINEAARLLERGLEDEGDTDGD